MNQRRPILSALPALLARHWVPLVALIVLALGCSHPVEALMPAHPPTIWPKVLYAVYLTLSLAFLVLPSTQVGRRFLGWWGLDVIFCTYTLVPMLQLALRLPRPQGPLYGVFAGFPSGHTVAAFALAWMVHRAQPRCSWLWFAMAVLIALSRIESQYHFPYQVWGGAVLGLVLGWWLSRYPDGLISPRLWALLKRLVPHRRPAAPHPDRA